jgi:hypothetical protein
VVSRRNDGLAAELRDRLAHQVQVWRSDLLTLDRRQRLVYFKHNRSASLELTRPSPQQLLESIDRAPQLLQPDDPDRPVTRGIAVSDKDETTLRTACRRLDLTSAQTFADRGFWTLYLGLGMLTWVDPADGAIAHSPILLCPVQLKRTGAQSPYTVERTDDEAVVNPALRLHLERDFSLKLPSVDEFTPDLDKLLLQVEDLVRGRPGWSVEQRTVLTTFSFHKEAIYRDLEDHEASVIAHPIVQMLALGAEAPAAGTTTFDTTPARDMDQASPPEKLVSILDADSSQRACIQAAKDGRSFVMDGPPGTGKSQTIANIIAELIAMGRTVLFVSEKAAALDVVRDRLQSKELGDFLFELHSHAATRKEVVSQLNRALLKRVTVVGELTEGQRNNLARARGELSNYARAMNEVRPGLERSVHEVLGRLMELHERGHKPLDKPETWVGLTPGRLDTLLAIAGRLGRAWRPVLEAEEFTWRELKAHEHSSSEIDRAKHAAQAAVGAAEALTRVCDAVDQNLLISWPVDLASASRRNELLDHLSHWETSPESWLVLESLDAVKTRIVALRDAARAYSDSAATLESLVGTDWASVDPDTAAPVLRATTHPELIWQPASDTSSASFAGAVDQLSSLPVRMVPLIEDARQLGALLGAAQTGISVRRAIELGHLAALGGSTALPERGWLNPAVQAALDESRTVLASLVELVNERRQAVEQVFSPAALDIDLSALDVRFKEVHKGMRRWSSAARADRKILKGVTVSGKADKTIRARLEEAGAWQRAERRLNEAEHLHADRLGSYYRRTDTDFARLEDAVRVAQRAIELAGNDLNTGPLAQQLAVGGDPDPRLTIISQRLLATSAELMSDLEASLGAVTAQALAAMPMDEAAALAGRAAKTLSGPLSAAQHVAAVARRAVTVGEAGRACETARVCSEASARIYNDFDSDRSLLGPSYDGLTTDWAVLERQLEWAGTARSLLAGPVPQESASRMREPVVLPGEIKSHLAQWATARGGLCDWFAQSRSAELAKDLNSDLREAAEHAQRMADTCVSDIEEWDAYATAYAELSAAGLTDTVEHLKATVAPSEAVSDTVEWAVLQAWTEGVIASDSRLHLHRAKDRDALVERFRQDDLQLVTKSNAAVAMACGSRRPRSFAGTAAQLIQKEAQKKTRHLPIRELLSRSHEIVQELKPCFMMSPLSVSQYLPGTMTFDVVIFDEASQVLPSDAVNCIYRGGQLIVAGDDKQLPPTSFFTQAVSEDDVDEDVDLYESVLKLCKSTMSSLPLTWHYRSQHESLITYSNYRFYAPDDQPLQTFPGAVFESPDLGVASYVVNGVYRRGGGRDNPAEADAVVDRLIFHRTHHPDLSIGVVTFSSAQEDAISAAIERRAATEPALAGLLDNHDRLTGFFVKNLENVQGDERDIVIFSIGYGPDETGKLSMNFGPINREGGWRRLNVAITRARKRVEVVSSFRAGDMRETNSEGLRHLKGYLDFAARGMPAIAMDLEESLGDAESPFEEDVIRVISSWGYDVVPQVGSAGYRLDMGVRHPDRPGEFVLGVECDGTAYHSAASARDRDRLRASVLEGLGWRLHRIWGISWYRDRAGQSALLKSAIESAIAGESFKAEAVVVEEALIEMDDFDPDTAPEWAVPYEVCGARAPHLWESLGSIGSRPALQDYITKVLEVEAPIHRDMLNARVRSAFGVGGIGSAIKENIDFVTRRITIGGRKVSVRQDGFIRVPDAPVVVRTPVDEDAKRHVSQVAPEELDLAVLEVIKDAVSTDEAGIISQVLALYGWKQRRADIHAAVQGSINRGIRLGEIERTAHGTLRVIFA